MNNNVSALSGVETIDIWRALGDKFYNLQSDVRKNGLPGLDRSRGKVGDSLSNLIYKKICDLFPGAVTPSDDEFKEMMAAVGSTPTQWIKNDRNMDFREIYGDTDVVIVNQPCGRQAYPDILIIIRGVGIMVEVKGSTNGTISWNCHVPVNSDHLYVFARTKKGREDITWSVGRNLVTKIERELAEDALKSLRSFNAKQKEAAETYSHSEVNIHAPGYKPEAVRGVVARQVWSDKVNPILSVNRQKREFDALSALSDLALLSRADPSALVERLRWEGSVGMEETDDPEGEIAPDD